jgi:hypothetical protein
MVGDTGKIQPEEIIDGLGGADGALALSKSDALAANPRVGKCSDVSQHP